MSKLASEFLHEMRALSFTRGKQMLNQLPWERFLQDFEFSRTFFPPASHRAKHGNFQKPVKTAHKAVVLMYF